MTNCKLNQSPSKMKPKLNQKINSQIYVPHTSYSVKWCVKFASNDFMYDGIYCYWKASETYNLQHIRLTKSNLEAVLQKALTIQLMSSHSMSNHRVIEEALIQLVDVWDAFP